jgi:hypothetical protein
LGLVNAPRRQHMVESVIKEIGQKRLPLPWVRIQGRYVKRVCSRYKHKKPEHWHAPALELDVEFLKTHCCGSVATRALPGPRNASCSIGKRDSGSD